MTREDVLQAYRPVRVAIQHVLEAASGPRLEERVQDVIGEIAPWAEDEQLTGKAIEMVMDIALFERDDDNQRSFDLFADHAEGALSPAERALVDRMRGAWFSLFRVEERHEAAGVWLEDLLDGDRRIWLMDEGIEQTTSPNEVIAMRVFEAGPFHAGFGIVVECPDDILGSCLAAQARRTPVPLALSSLAALVYSDTLAEDVLSSDDELDAAGTAELMENLASILREASMPTIEPRVALNKPKSKRVGRREG